jgi:hypothetical protein
MTLLVHVSMFSSARHLFSREEDEVMRTLILRIRSNDEVMVAQFMPGRTPRQCSRRYNSCLTGRYRLTAWAEAKKCIVIEKYPEIGPKWAYISRLLAERTGNDVKSQCYKHLAKQGASRQQSPTNPIGIIAIEIVAKGVISPAARRLLSQFLQFALN